MSEQQKSNYMHELDGWADATVIGPVFAAAQEFREEYPADFEETVAVVKEAIRNKVLESYRNGQASKGRPAATALSSVAKPWMRR